MKIGVMLRDVGQKVGTGEFTGARFKGGSQ